MPTYHDESDQCPLEETDELITLNAMHELDQWSEKWKGQAGFENIIQCIEKERERILSDQRDRAKPKGTS